MFQKIDVKRWDTGLPVIERKENCIEIQHRRPGTRSGMPFFVLGCLAILAAFTGGLKALFIGLLVAVVCIVVAMKARESLYIIDLDAMLFTWKITGIKFLDAGTIGLDQFTSVGIETVEMQGNAVRPGFTLFRLFMQTDTSKRFYLNYGSEKKDLLPLMNELHSAVQKARKLSDDTPETLLHEQANGSTFHETKIELPQERVADEHYIRGDD